MSFSTRPLSLTSPGFSTLLAGGVSVGANADRPPLSKSASDSNLAESGGLNCNGADAGSNDLNREVATLSNKLISAINHQTKLDDSLAATKHELELSKARIRQLEATAKEHADMMAKGLLVEKKTVETETKKLMTKLKEESKQRAQADKDKKHIEQELENLTTALFDEANKMVSAARKERDAVDRKNEQLRAQLADTEQLLASHQQQLAELKQVMQQMNKEREENEAAMSSPGVPQTPLLRNRHSKESVFESLHLVPNSMNVKDMVPCPPTSLTNLVHPVLRHDVAAFKEFCEVLYTPPKPADVIKQPSHGGSTLGSSLFGYKRRTDSGSTTHSPSGSTSSSSEWQANLNALKETKFFKRAMVEDIEPTLRLDLAPGLSWLARRNVMSAITEGTLVIDPMPTAPSVSMFACSLCGESKADQEHARTHRMRINENPNAQRYPLCQYCTNRLRTVGDFMAFLRTLKEGLWKCESEGDRQHAWEESVKLRERCFWARIGGGVIPAFIRGESRRNSLNNQTETPPRTPVLAGMMEEQKLNIPKKRNSQQNPYLTPERQMAKPSTVPSPLQLPKRVVPDDKSEVISVKAEEPVQEPEATVEKSEPEPEIVEKVEDPRPATLVEEPAAEISLPESPEATRQPPVPASTATEIPTKTKEALPSPTIPGGW